jgi:hypothetical protein
LYFIGEAVVEEEGYIEAYTLAYIGWKLDLPVDNYAQLL